MARCMLCSSTVAATDVVCPLCGGAVEEEPGDAAPHAAHGAGSDATHVQGIDLTEVDGPPAAETAWPGEAPGPFSAPGASAPPEGPPGSWGGGTYPGFTYGPPPVGYGYGPPPGAYGPPPGAYGSGPPSGAFGPPPAFGPPAAYPGPYPPAAYGSGAWPGYTPPRPTEGLAVASLVSSLVGLVTASMLLVPILACPVGAALGHVALRRIDQNGTQGRGMALAGVIVGWVGTALLVLGTAVIVAVVVASS